MNQKSLIIKNLASNYLVSFFGMALGFFLIPFLVGKLGKDVYGLIVLAEAALGFFELVTVSVRVALSRYATFSLSQNKMDGFVRYLSTGRVILFFSSAVVFITGTLISFNFPHFFKVPPELYFQSKLLFFLVTVAVSISIPNIIFWSVLYAKQRFDLINASASVGLILRAGLLFAYYSLAPKEYAYMAVYGVIYLGMTFAQNGMVYFFHKKLVPGVRFSVRFFQWEKVREILSFSAHTSLARGSALLYEETETIIINVFWGPASNAIFFIGNKIPSLMGRIFLEPGWALTPTFTDMVARGDKKKLETLFFMYSKLLSIMTFPFCFLIFFFTRPIILRWMGPDFEMSADLMRLFIVQLFINIPFSMNGCIFNAYGKVRIPSIVNIVMGISNVALCLVLGLVLDLKLYGVALSGIIVGAIYGVIFCPAYACRIAGLSLRKYWTESFIKPFLMVSIFFGGGIIVLIMVEHDLRLDPLMALLTLLSTGLHYLASYHLILKSEEKIHVLDIIRTAIEKVKRLLPGR